MVFCLATKLPRTGLRVSLGSTSMICAGECAAERNDFLRHALIAIQGHRFAEEEFRGVSGPLDLPAVSPSREYNCWTSFELRVGLHSLEYFNAVDPWHMQVQNDHTRPHAVGQKEIEGRFPIAGRNQLDTFI